MNRWTYLKHGESGTMTLVNAIVVLFGILLAVLMLNVGHITYEKVGMQHAADAVAYSGAVWQARGLNAITATNHVIGELNSLVILHEAVGGEVLEAGSTAEATAALKAKSVETGGKLVEINTKLELARRAAQAAQARTDAFQTVREAPGVHADATILDGKATLKKMLTQVYGVKVVAKGMQAFPPTRPAGVALEKAMDALELKILQEYRALNAVEGVARRLLPLKKIIRDQVMPAAKQSTTRIAELIPDIAVETAKFVGEKHQVEGSLFPVSPQLPVVVDPHAKANWLVTTESVEGPLCRCPIDERGSGRDQIVKITQLARATFPWVNYHRQPVLQLLGAVAPLSKAKDFYFHHSNGYSKRVCDRLQMDKHDMGLYVLRDDGAPDKGYAVWTERPERADRLFTLIGLARRDPPRVVGIGSAFTQEHAEGRVAYAQAIVYNANAQVRHPCKIDLTCKRITPWIQANVGWDTLNWKPGSEQYELVGFGAGLVAKFPEIQVNWQAKLVPATATRLADLHAASGTLGAAGGVVEKMLDQTPESLRTH